MDVSNTGKTAADRAVDKSTKRLIPFLLLMYVLAFLDRANVGFAKQALHDMVGISDTAFAFGASIFFIAYVLLEIPSNLAMHKVGARVWMCRIMVTWGLVSAATMFVQGSASFYVLRFILGACEAGFFPGVILYFTYWFPDHTRAKVMGLFYFGAPLAFMFGSPLSGYLLRFDGLLGLHGYQWMFMLEGLSATAVGIWAYFYLDDKPADARWLDVDEKKALIAMLQTEQSAKVSHGPHGIGSALTDRTVLYFGLIFFLIQMGVSVVVFYLPTFVGKLLGTGPNAVVGFVVAIPWTCALIATFAVPRLAARGDRLVLFGCASLLIAAIAMFVSAGASPSIAMIALCLAVAGLWAVQPIFWSMLTNYLGGMAVVSGVAMVNTIGNVGNFVSPNVKAWADASFGSSVAGLILLSAVVVWRRSCSSGRGVLRSPPLRGPSRRNAQHFHGWSVMPSRRASKAEARNRLRRSRRHGLEQAFAGSGEAVLAFVSSAPAGDLKEPRGVLQRLRSHESRGQSATRRYRPLCFT